MDRNGQLSITMDIHRHLSMENGLERTIKLQNVHTDINLNFHRDMNGHSSMEMDKNGILME